MTESCDKVKIQMDDPSESRISIDDTVVGHHNTTFHTEKITS